MLMTSFSIASAPCPVGGSSLESLKGQDIETVLIAADQGLQAVPFAAVMETVSLVRSTPSIGRLHSLTP